MQNETFLPYLTDDQMTLVQQVIQTRFQLEFELMDDGTIAYYSPLASDQSYWGFEQSDTTKHWYLFSWMLASNSDENNKITECQQYIKSIIGHHLGCETYFNNSFINN